MISSRAWISNAFLCRDSQHALAIAWAGSSC
jgi:hypothetical protein